MSAVAYLLLPVSGVLAFLLGRDARVRFHGLQAIALGLVWPVALYAASAGPPSLTRIVFLIGAVVWFGFMAGAALGRNPMLPILGSFLRRAAKDDVRALP